MKKSQLTFGSLFTGIGGFDLGLQRAGLVCKWQVEVDPYCLKVLQKHWPDVPRYGDIRDVGQKELEPVDVVCGGFPCQDLSIAGNRTGLAGERSGLWFEFYRIIKEMLPRFVVIENVPGLLSSNDGKDIQIIIDGLTQIGYTIDIDIKDAQEFGLAQRRRRVFLLCVRLDVLLKEKTNFSRQISADLLAQILLNTWTAIPPASSPVPLHSVYEKPIEQSVDLLKKMMTLLSITRERSVSRKYQDNLTALLDQFGVGDKGLGFGLTKKSEIHLGENSRKMDMLLSGLRVENGEQSMSLLLKKVLDDVCKTEKQSTTSTSTNRITDQKIFTFAVMALYITGRILQSLDWSVSCWSVASLLSIFLQESTNYARQASSHLFIEAELRNSWWDYLSIASRFKKEIERHTGAICEQQILFERESSAGDTPPGRETGAGVAETFTIRSGKDGGGKGYLGIKERSMTLGPQPQFLAYGGNNTNGPINRATAVNAHGSRRYDFESETFAFQQNTRDEVRLMGGNGQIAGALPAQPGMKQQNYVCNTFNGYTGGADDNDAQGGHLVASVAPTLQKDSYSPTKSKSSTGQQLDWCISQPAGVRRLTPTECERLQGFSFIENRTVIDICLDHQKNYANVEIRNRKLQKPVGDVEKTGSKNLASSVVRNLKQRSVQTRKPARLTVLINYEQGVVEIRNQEKSLLSANIADKKNSSPLPMPTDDFVYLIAGLNTIAGKIIRFGKGELLLNEPNLMGRQNGEGYVKLYGNEIMRRVKDAISDTTINLQHTRFIISNHSDTRSLEQNLTTLFCYVLTAITGFIQMQIKTENFYRIELVEMGGWTSNQSDTQRYRQLGNAVAVPVAEWIGRRLFDIPQQV